MSSMILGGCIPSPKKQTEAITVEENPNMMYMLVGSYATPEEEGIKVYNFDEQNGNSQYISGIKGISNPSFLIPSADGERIYAVGEDSGKSSTANAIKFDKEQKKLTLLNSQPTDGGAPCYITLSPSEKFVLTANYIGGSITVFPLDKDGKLKSETRLISFTGNSLDKERQTQPHLHCIEFTPDHKYLLASDLGTDQIHVFPVSENVTDGVSHSLLNESEEFNIKVESGSGPRHICFHPNQKFAYLINLKSATKPFNVLLACTSPLITELADKLRQKHPNQPTISPYPTMRLEAIRSIIPISCRRYPKSV